MVKHLWKLVLMVVIALSVGVVVGHAATDTFYRATGTASATSDTTVVRKDGVLMSAEPDFVNMRGDDDTICMGYGDDALVFYGGLGIISFDQGTWADWFNADYETYIKCNTADGGEQTFATEMEVRADEVQITANEGRVIIRLGD